MDAVDLDRLRRLAAAAGLQHLGCTSAEPFESTRETLLERRAAGLNGSMEFTYRNPQRSTDPQATLPGARSIIVGARSYHRDLPAVPEGVGPVARAGRYVWADDQARLLAGLDAVASELKSLGHRACVVSDQNHLVDRAAAHRGGLGWFGKNANLLLPSAGSWFLLGSVITDAEVTDPARPSGSPPVADGCGTCTRCIDSCPTGAIVAPGVVDARLCLSWTLQTTGTFPRDQRIAVADRIYGCDDCQEVCPPNRLEIRRVGPGGHASAVEVGDPDRAWAPVLRMLDADDDQLMAAHGNWYIPERNPRYLRRNALVVLANVGDGSDKGVRRALQHYLAHGDPLLRAHAVWSARRLGCDDLLVIVRDDTDTDVQFELTAEMP